MLVQRSQEPRFCAPLGITSMFFIMIQPVVIGTWSTLALIAAALPANSLRWRLLITPFIYDANAMQAIAGTHADSR